VRNTMQLQSKCQR